MFEARRRRTNFEVMLSLAELTYITAVRKVRQAHANALIGLMINIFQAVMFVAAFYMMFALLGVRGAAVRGNFILYLLSGIYIYLTHIKALAAVTSAEGAASPMMQHAPMNTLVAILSAALSVLYQQTLALLIILFALHMLIEPVVIHDWPMALAMYLLSWFSGIAVGLIFLGLKPWLPDLASIFQQIWSRANMIASGKMFVANQIGSAMVALFAWNPLFHIIDQCRGAVFANYFPRFTNWEYPLYLCMILTLIGFIGQHVTRMYASESWSARR